ncbi:hypothetical protein Smlt2494 [Stenotrophomonas maltophilia K279a]|uniref:Uncharacterized protein n=1 Tax=Stenotrophomonas maltophilia (strain K279a) TaxID=522373 RepID=B2FS74_STRMK|nr:hypothetical protein Smlt2494 [Stenotrophomonas maltophilia K279a]
MSACDRKQSTCRGGDVALVIVFGCDSKQTPICLWAGTCRSLQHYFHVRTCAGLLAGPSRPKIELYQEGGSSVDTLYNRIHGSGH